VTPVIYLYLEDFQEKVLDRTSFFRSHRAHVEAHGGDRTEDLVPAGANGNGEMD